METKMNLKDCRDGIQLDVPEGYFMCWNFTTQAANTVHVVLYDDAGTVYMDEVRRSTEPMPMISGNAYMNGKQLFLKIDIPESSCVEVRKNSWDIVGQEGELLARSIVILAEDYIDYDYNDVQISLCAFRYKG